jgi:putative DNA primase/helicase
MAGRIAIGKLSIIAGDPGLGKSMIAIAMATHVTRGTPWPVDLSTCPIGDVLMLSAEDDPADTIRPRLDAAGPDAKRVHMLSMVHDVDSNTGEITARSFSLKRDIPPLYAALAQWPNTGW